MVEEKGEDMEMKIKLLGTLMALLLATGFLGFFGFRIVVDAPPPTPTVARAEYEYYVVAGHQMTPTLPPPASQPDGFTFTLEGFGYNNSWGLHSLGTGGYNAGNMCHHGGRDYLSYGSSIAEPTGTNWNAYVVVNITNNLGYTITIEDLTGEVTDGTPKGYGLPGGLWLWDVSGENYANISMVSLDSFDPWDSTLVDEVDYNTGEVHQIREHDHPDHIRAVTGVGRAARMGRGPYSLLLNDLNGDANSTGHVAPKYGGSPITLADDETFTEYFGLNIYGDVTVGTQINATITLRLYYSPPPEGTTADVDVQISNFKPMFPALLDDTTYLYPEWENVALTASVHNRGNVPVNVTVGVYYLNNDTGNWVQIESSQNVFDLDITNETTLIWYWDLKAENRLPGWTFLKANATATSGDDPSTAEFNIKVRIVLTGNADGDGDVDVGDQRKVQLAMFTSYPDEVYIDWQNKDNPGPQIFTDFDGDGDVDVGDQRKQQLKMFWTDPTVPTS